MQPLYWDGRLVGYERRSGEHAENDKWVKDLVRSFSAKGTKWNGKQLRVKPGKRDGQVTIDELVAAVNNALGGCPE